ncbi:hypothetical protein LIA77_04133 [Sarocladium implicatum]|nr:hypothetical protein LIA77_04133 [Sarocladium implicatum]
MSIWVEACQAQRSSRRHQSLPGSGPSSLLHLISSCQTLTEPKMQRWIWTRCSLNKLKHIPSLSALLSTRVLLHSYRHTEHTEHTEQPSQHGCIPNATGSQPIRIAWGIHAILPSKPPSTLLVPFWPPSGPYAAWPHRVLGSASASASGSASGSGSTT